MTGIEHGPGTFVLVGCGAAKASEPRPAGELYTSTYFALKRRYARAATAWTETPEQQQNAWSVLSAEHGVYPSALTLAPYDTAITDLDDAALDTWADRVRTALTSWLYHPFRSDTAPKETPAKRLIVLAGREYVTPLVERDVFERARPNRKAAPIIEIHTPFQDQGFDGIGEQMSWLADQIEQISVGQTTVELEAFGAGIERERARWQMDRKPVPDIEQTEQTALATFENPPDYYRSTEQRSLAELPTGSVR